LLSLGTLAKTYSEEGRYQANRLYYVPAPHGGGTSELMFYSFATRKSTLILPMGMPGWGLDVSPDGRYLAYAQVDNPGSDLMLIENFH
jgi:hypothetical protein